MAFLSVYDPHEYSEARVRALATGRDDPLAEILVAVRQNLAGPTLQHLIVSAPRGFGKSFLMRLVQVEIERIAREETLPLSVALMPEEMPHVKEPESLPRELARVLRGKGGDAAELTWHEDDGEAWEEAVADLATAVREKLGDHGLLVAIVENFDVLLRRAFPRELHASRLRDWLSAPNGRVMLLAASASGAFDRNYDDRLFQAFREIPLEPWTVEECMDFFDRQRREAGKPALEAEASARARAVASFIGGAPRLAVLLGDALFDGDVLRAADLLDRVQHELTPYYKARIEALPGRSQKLLDALLRFGEPATQTELAARVNARGQTAIAEPFKDLVRERVVIGEKVEGSAEVRYRVADRIFAHYYRRRVVDHGAELCPLEAMVDLLADFYSPAQKAAKAGEFARLGRLAEARVMARLHDAETGGKKRGRKGILRRLADSYVPHRLVPLAEPAVAEALRETAALARAGDIAGAYARLEGTHAQGGQLALLLLARGSLDAYEGVEGGLPAVEAASAAVGEEGDVAARILVENARAWALAGISRYEDALAAARRAVELAEMAGDMREQAVATRHAAFSLAQLGRHEEAVAAARRAAELAEAAGYVAEQAEATRYAAFSLGQLGRHEEAVAAARRAAELAEAAGDVAEQAVATRHAAFSLGQLGRHEEAVAAARRAAELAEAAGDVAGQAEATRHAAFNLGQLGRHEEAVAAARRAAELAEAAGDVFEIAHASRQLAHALVDADRLQDSFAPLARASTLFSVNADLDSRRLDASLDITARTAARRLSAQAAGDALTAVLAAASAAFDASDDLRATLRRWMQAFVSAGLRELSDPDRLRLWADAVALRFGERFADLVGRLRAAGEYHASGRDRRVLAKLDPDLARTLELMFEPAEPAKKAKAPRRGRGA